MSGLCMYFLGAPRIELDGSVINVDTRKAIALMAYLAMADRSVGRDTLAALLWPDYDQSHARGALRRTLSVLNQSLSQPDSYLEINRESLGLIKTGDYWVDVDRFHAAIAHCETHGHSRQEICPSCLAPLQEAAELYQGDFLAGFSLRDSAEFDDWQFYTSEGLRRELAGVLQKLSNGLARQGEFAGAIRWARRWLALDPLLEEAHRALMQIYAWGGQRSAALRQYQECVRFLDQELGVEPLEETEALYQAILENRLPGPEPFREPAGRVQAVAAPAAEPEPPASTLPEQGGSPYPLVGRSVETEKLLHLYRSISGDGFLLALCGEAGIGKTRLAEEFMAYAGRQGAVVLSARCYEGEKSLPYAPLIEGLRAALSNQANLERLGHTPEAWLAETKRLLPELEMHFPNLSEIPPIQGPAAQEHFFEGVRQSLAALSAGPHPAVLLLDDAHWADEGTLDLLAYFVRRLSGWPCLVLVTLRDEELEITPRLAQLIAAAQRSRLGEHMDLSRLEQKHVEDLVRSLSSSGLNLPEGLGQRLYQEAEGLPFFIVEYLTALKEDTHSQAGGPAENGYLPPMPRSVRDLLHSRLEGVDEASRQLLSAAAVIGRSFDFDILREASGRSESEAINAIETLLSRKVIREQEAEGTIRAAPVYDFFHDKLRELIYAETSQVRLRLLHRRVAESLAHLPGAQRGSGALAGEIAFHYQKAGQPAQAAHYFRQAGEYAASVFANSQALAHYRSALSLSGDQAPEELSGLHEAIADLHTLLGNYRQARDSYAAAAAVCNPGCRFGLETKLGDVSDRLGDWVQAENHFQAALEAMPADLDPAEQARLYAIWSRAAYHRGQNARANELAQMALALAGESQATFALAQATNTLGMLSRSQGDAAEAITYFEKSLSFAQDLNDPGARVAAMNNLSLAYQDQGDLEQAISVACAALNLCEQQGDRHRQAAIHNNLADLYYASGDTTGSMGHLKRAVALFNSVGDETGDLKPETWKLTDW